VSTSQLKALVSELETVMKDYLDEEEKRVKAERDFLLSVLDGRADGVSIEDTSSQLTETYLYRSLNDLIPITNSE
jgi:hypothetical protein